MKEYAELNKVENSDEEVVGVEDFKKIQKITKFDIDICYNILMGGYYMKKGNDKKNTYGYLIIFLIIFLLIFLPILVGLISNNINASNQAKHEAKLIEEGKTKTHNEVINEIIELLKNKDNENLREYISNDFVYYDNDNIAHRYISDFLQDLKILSSTYEIERRGDTNLNDLATYRIYWNIVEENKKRGIDKTNSYYCLQKITIMLKRVVKEDIITYEIQKIVLNNN